jgi:hypothetical protein
MVSDLYVSQMVLVALVWMCLMLRWTWPRNSVAPCLTIPEFPCPLPKCHCYFPNYLGSWPLLIPLANGSGVIADIQ